MWKLDRSAPGRHRRPAPPPERGSQWLPNLPDERGKQLSYLCSLPGIVASPGPVLQRIPLKPRVLHPDVRGELSVPGFAAPKPIAVNTDRGLTAGKMQLTNLVHRDARTG